MNIKKYEKFFIKKGFNKDGPIIEAHLKYLREFLKDNPVASIDFDKLAKKYIKKNEIIDISTLHGVFGLAGYLKQNAVETNKEQPKCELREDGICNCKPNTCIEYD
ncbi:MAG: hypothetical protein ACSLE0_15355 [Chitinophagaceae bacterium]